MELRGLDGAGVLLLSGPGGEPATEKEFHQELEELHKQMRAWQWNEMQEE